MHASVVSFGGGVNSSALLIGLWERQERPDYILFADTGGERPDTYAHIDVMRNWCHEHDFPDIIRVSELQTLEVDCLQRHALPGLAYGFRSCSEHFKVRPQKRWLREHGVVPSFWLGIDAGEAHRAKEGNRYPLIEWGWDRKDCLAALHHAGIPSPGKSACFFCPSTKKHEILRLKEKYPDLLDRALRMESQAEVTMVKGLGRSFAWRDVCHADDQQLSLFAPEILCACYDG